MADGETDDRDGWLSPGTAALLVVLPVLVVGAWLAPGLYDALTGHGEWVHAPSATLGSEYDRGSNALAIVHRGDDGFVAENTDRLVVVVTTPGGGTENHAIGLPFEPCDTYVVTVPPGSRVEAVWHGPGRRPAMLASFDAPETVRETTSAETTTTCPG